MSFAQTILLSLTVCLLIIGVHQSTINGFANSYWIFMLMFISLILFQTFKNKSLDKEEKKEAKTSGKERSVKGARSRKKQ